MPVDEECQMAEGPAAECRRRTTRQQFESLLADVFVQFVRLPADAVDSLIEVTQERVCTHLGYDRSCLWQVVEARDSRLVLTHAWQHPSFPPVLRNPDAATRSDASWARALTGTHPAVMNIEAEIYFPNLLAAAEKLDPIVIPDSALLPDALAGDRELLERFGAHSLVILPLVDGQRFLGVLTFELLHRTGAWPDDVVRRLRLVAEAFAAALSRRRAEDSLRLTNARLDLATDGAGVGLWSLDVASDKWWVTPRALGLFGLGADEAFSRQKLLDAIVPEDRSAVNAVLDRVISEGVDGTAEYRVQRPDGQIRWLLSRGRLYAKGIGGGTQVMGITMDITARKTTEEELKTAYVEVKKLRDALEGENSHLREAIRGYDGHGAIIGESQAVAEMLAQAKQVGPTDSAVLIMGETGTGKELLAEAIHQWSPRAKRGMVKVNCAALPASLIESELFGRERGAYTGAMSRQPGRFEAADGSTIFLDEIAELPPDLQAKLLRVLQEGQFERLGSNRTQTVNVRVIAATNRNLEELIQQGMFRSDLFYRLNVFPIRVPPLREREGDIPLLVWKFVSHFATKMGKSIDAVPRQAMESLTRYPWPGNIRELRNLIERAVILSNSHVLRLECPKSASGSAGALTLEEAERQHIESVLLLTRWQVSGPGGAAAKLGVIPTTLRSKMKKLGITKPQGDAAAARSRRVDTAARATISRQSYGIS